MHRCARAAAAFGAALALALPARAQMHRPFPANALRGELVVLNASEVQLNGQPARLAPGARIRGANNLITMPGALTGQAAVVNFTIDEHGLVKDVWVLNDEERAKQPWPKTLQEAASWRYDPVSQTWSKP